MAYKNVTVPANGEKITIYDGTLQVPSHPVIPFVEGDGTGRDIWRASVRVFDAAVEKAYRGKRKIHWMEVLAGEKAYTQFNSWLPDETVEAFSEFLVGIKGPLTTPIGGGIRSLNVALRKALDLYVCQRPVRYFTGVPSPVKHPEYVDMVVFRENTEDIYTGIEFELDSEDNQRFKSLLKEHFPKEYAKIRFPETAGIGLKPVSREGTFRLVRSAVQWALENKRRSVTLVHKGNIMKFTEGAFRNWGYELARDEFPDQTITENDLYSIYGGKQPAGKVVIKDRIADIIFQLLQLRPEEFSVLATMNLNGDYLSDAVAAEVGGIGIAPGANMADYVAVFEATHGTAPKYANLDKVNPGSLMLSGVMMLQYMGWIEAADLIESALTQVIADKTVTYDFARQMDGGTEVSTSKFGDLIIAKMREQGPALRKEIESRRRTWKRPGSPTRCRP